MELIFGVIWTINPIDRASFYSFRVEMISVKSLLWRSKRLVEFCVTRSILRHQNSVMKVLKDKNKYSIYQTYYREVHHITTSK